MARYKPYSYAQGKFIPIHFANQILPGTFEYTLNHLVDHARSGDTLWARSGDMILIHTDICGLEQLGRDQR
jgi:hypothetical protein